MPATFVKGDIFEEASDASRPGRRAIAFGADCTGAMGAGVAAAIKKQWPAFAEAYAARCAGNKMQPGDVFAWSEGDLFVYALGLHRGDIKPKISHFERALRAAVERAAHDQVPRVLLARFGAGKAAMDRLRVKRVLTEVGASTPVDVVFFEQFVRKATATA